MANGMQMENVSNPEHYQHGLFETIDEMVIIFGVKATRDYCRINAWKYRARAPFKGQFETDMRKADWYMKKARELSVIMETSSSDVTLSRTFEAVPFVRD